MSGKINEDLVVCLNILYLLRSKPRKYRELWESGYFRNENDLDFGLRKLYHANCIGKIEAVTLYAILGNGLSFLSLYPNWMPIPVKTLDIIVPLGRQPT